MTVIKKNLLFILFHDLFKAVKMLGIRLWKNFLRYLTKYTLWYLL